MAYPQSGAGYRYNPEWMDRAKRAEGGPVEDWHEPLQRAGAAIDHANDTLDFVDSKIPTLTGGDPLPRRRPIAAGPDAAGNDRSANAPQPKD